MRIKSVLILFTLFVAFLSSCKKYKHEEFGNDLAKAFNNKVYKDFDTTAYFTVFNEVLNETSANVHHPKWMGEIYKNEGTGLALIGKYLVNNGIDSLQQTLKKAKEHGLNSDFFHANEIENLISEVKNGKFSTVSDTYPLLAKLEIYSADGLINYVNILKYGAINPKKIYGKYYDKVKRPDFINAKESLENVDMLSMLKEVQPKNHYYKKMQQVLIDNQSLSKQDVQKIYLSLERLRWPTKNYPSKYILVNIPEFNLRVIDNNMESFRMKVCVGETDNEGFSRKGVNHETPILSGAIDRMQVNPVWNIPKSIAGKEIMTKLVNNPSYLEENNMVVYNRSNELVDASEIDWSAASVNDYAFKQNPGLDNSLGKIKFIFKNPYAIYLHDTPAKQMFAQKNRAVSHGCVRVEDPIKLASFLLNDKAESDRVTAEINDAEGVSRWVKLKEPVLVYLAYYTAWVNDKGSLITAPDVYGQDKKLKEVLVKYLPKDL